MDDIIQTKEDLRRFKTADRGRLGKIGIKDFLLQNDDWKFFCYLTTLRNLEYHLNKGHKLRTFIYTVMHKWNCNRLHINTYPNTIGPGVRFYHIGNFTEIYRGARIGSNCTLLSGTVIGNKQTKRDENVRTIIGNNCYFGLNSFVGGNITIGNNVTVGTNAVVTKDFPDNAIIAGVPAKIIKFSHK